MSTPLHHKRSAVPGKIPTTSDLALGELAINTYDGKIYLKRNVGGTETVIDVTATAAGASWGGITGTLSDQADLQTALNAKAPNSHVGAGGVSNHPNATGATSGFMAAADKTKLDGIASGAQVNTITSVAGKTGAVTLVKADVGLTAVDNTSDADKPVSTAQAAAIATKADTTATINMSTGGLSLSIADLSVVDNSIKPGIYHFTNSTPGAPSASGGSYHLIHNRRAGGGGEVQIAIYENTGAMYVRGRVTGAWSAWRTVYTSGNFDPATKQDLASAWNTGNFDPATKQDAATAWNTSNAPNIPDLNPGARLGASAVTITDWNNATDNGWYMASGAANAPTVGAWYIGIVSKHNSLYSTQEVWNFTAGPTTERYVRHKRNGVWDAWTNSVTHTAPEFKQKTTTEMAMFIKNNSATPWNPPAGKVFGQYYNEALATGAVQFVHDYATGTYHPLFVQASKWGYSSDGSNELVAMGGAGQDSTYSLLRVAGGVKSTGVYAQLSFADRTTARDWTWYASADQARLWNGASVIMTISPTGEVGAKSFNPTGANGGYIDGNGSGMHLSGTKYLANGETYLLWANASNWVRVPRIFVGGTDPGAAAADGDLWIV